MAEQKTSEDQSSAFSDRELYTIPSRSSWFRWDEIHDTERLELPEFFDGSSFSRNPRVYKEYRDFIINKYREDVSRRLTFTEVRRSLVGDVGSINRIFLFLDRWGLINFSNGRNNAAEDSYVLVEDTPPSTVKVVPNNSSSISGTFEAGNSFAFAPLSSYNDVFRHRIRIPCSSCGGECLSGYYESKSGSVVCIKCFGSLKSEEAKAVEDYKFHDRNFSDRWNERETLSLLEAVVSKGPDWDLISNHVRRNRIECIRKLVCLPFGDIVGPDLGKFEHFARMKREAEESVKENVPDNGVSKKRKFFPSLADVNDSLSEQVSALSKIGGLDVASTAADVAISELCKENSFAEKVFKSRAGDQDDDVRTDFSRSIFQIRAAAATSLATAAARAKLLADQEERQMECLVAYIIDLQMKKMDHKMKHFEELESIMEQEYNDIQSIKEDIIHEWIDVSHQALSAGIPRWKDGLTKSSSLIHIDR